MIKVSKKERLFVLWLQRVLLLFSILLGIVFAIAFSTIGLISFTEWKSPLPEIVGWGWIPVRAAVGACFVSALITGTIGTVADR